MKDKVGIYIGRFQPFHNGHLFIANKAMEEVDKLIIAVGSAEQGFNKSNPFTLEERVRMIEKSLTGNYEVVAVPDIHNYTKWVEHVETLCGKFDIVYTGSPITRKLFGDAGYEIKSFNLELKANGTQIREKMYASEAWEHMVPVGTLKVLKEINGAERVRNLLPKFYTNPITTVDAIVHYNGGIVIIQRGREPFKDKYALPGGHVDYGESAEQAIVREVEEETGLKFQINGLHGVYSYPSRDPRGHYVTIVYHGTAEGDLTAGDDAKKTNVVNLNKVPELAFDHSDIVNDYRRKIK